ncbi:hypothetical protein ACLK19_22490 [Escherichia coli]
MASWTRKAWRQKNGRWCCVWGCSLAATFQQKLIEHGMPGEMPVAIVEKTEQRSAQHVINELRSQLGELAQQMNSPSLIIIASRRVVGLRDQLNWFSNH